MKKAPLLNGRRGRGWWVAAQGFRATTPDPSLTRRGIIFMHGGEPKDHDIFAQDDRREVFFRSLLEGFQFAFRLMGVMIGACSSAILDHASPHY
jgi:hypothetical protein